MDDQLELHGIGIRLRRADERDRAALTAIWSTPEVRLRWRGEDVNAELTDALRDPALEVLTVEDPESRAVLGLIQYSEEDDPDYRHASIDIFLDPRVHGRGLGREAIRTLVAHLRDERGHHRITIDPAVDNEPAIRCYRAVGFRPVGVMRRYERRTDGSWGDGLLMELLVDEDSGAGRGASEGAVDP